MVAVRGDSFDEHIPSCLCDWKVWVCWVSHSERSPRARIHTQRAFTLVSGVYQDCCWSHRLIWGLLPNQISVTKTWPGFLSLVEIQGDGELGSHYFQPTSFCEWSFDHSIRAHAEKRQNDSPRGFPHVVRKPSDHGVVGWPLAEWRLCAILRALCPRQVATRVLSLGKVPAACAWECSQKWCRAESHSSS